MGDASTSNWNIAYHGNGRTVAQAPSAYLGAERIRQQLLRRRGAPDSGTHGDRLPLITFVIVSIYTLDDVATAKGE